LALLRVSEIRAMSREERMKKLGELRAELIRLRAMAARGTLDKTSSLREIRRAIARILTVNREEELGIRPSKTGE